MKKARKWQVITSSQVLSTTSQIKKQDIIERIMNVLLENRGINTKEEIEEFLNPRLDTVTPERVGIDTKQLSKTLKRIKEAIKKQEQIVVFGDYDVDGITGTAILWETLHHLKAKVTPYIPNRLEEGYGLSIAGIKNIQEKCQQCTLIITVDNGIVAHEAVDFANTQGIDVIITDHHTIGKELPNAYALVHTTQLCGASVGWLVSQELKGKKDTEHLDLVALATVADLVPVTHASRAVLTEGLKFLQHTQRPGLQALFEEAKIDPTKIGVYEIGHIIAPRLNAMGRLESAMESLRLLCTKDPNRARMLAALLGDTNKDRQLLTQAHSLHAIETFRLKNSGIKKLLFIADGSYEEGVIGLIAGKLVEEYYRPAIVLSIGEKISKASARSIAGFNIIEFIRSSSELLLNAGGHPMAAGFTIETEKIGLLQVALEAHAEQLLTEELLTATLRIDCEIPLVIVTKELYDRLQSLAPFGMKNPEPVFVTKQAIVEDMKVLSQGKHLKLIFTNEERSALIEAIAFGMGEKAQELKKGVVVDVVYSIDENEWQGRKKVQLKVKDIKKS